MTANSPPQITQVKRQGRLVKFNRGPAIAMPAHDPAVRITNFEEVNLGYDREQTALEAYRCLECAHKPCVEACPTNQRIPDYVAALARGDYEESARIIFEDNPLPETCGRVCPAFCEAACVRAKKSDPVQIASLKRAAVSIAESLDQPNGEGPGFKVAIVGAGPAGLTAGYYLARRGYQPVIFERGAQPGGVMRYLIPPYRLPQEALDKDIQRIEAAGVEFACNQTLGTDFTIPDLFEQGFEAVFVALGTWVSKQMGLEGEASTEGVIGALDFLSLTNRGQVQVPARVAVIGAGSTAMDCVRSAARLGASQASIVYRRTFAEMTADKRELKEAKEEGIDFRLLTLPVRILCTNGKVTGLVCQQMELGEPDASGRPRPVPVDDSEFTLPVDMVVIAVSQQAEMEWNQADQKHDPTNQEHVGHEEPLVLTRWNTLEVDPETMATSWEGVYAAGDIVTGPRTIVEAIAGGKQAAESIITYLEAKHGEALTEALDASLTA